MGATAYAADQKHVLHPIRETDDRAAWYDAWERRVQDFVFRRGFKLEKGTQIDLNRVPAHHKSAAGCPTAPSPIF